MWSPTCPYGHPLTPGDVLVGWSPCTCPPAWAAHKGHRSLQCWTCHAYGITSVRYEPPHIGGGHPNRRNTPAH
ncbi:hypothetical protein [Actinomadura rugatobispora]|uniref:hypothetical protein n=1 Tax=Actinomadura rugatobispora TaxID=1994 RepID=UPI00366F6272|nr:hypothetical protein GCM10010200_036650 [Actinomadura rugatobispora]